MRTLIGHHNVKDRNHWLASPKRKEIFGSIGVTNIREFVDTENPSQVSVMMDGPDMTAFHTLMGSQAGADAMAHDGVLPETLVVLVEV